MKIIISPAKKMNVDNDFFLPKSIPAMIDKTKVILECLQSMSFEELQKLWGCNQSLAALNYRRIMDMDLFSNLTPAIMSYEGLQYQHIAAGVFTDSQLDYIDNNLVILSGFYGALGAFDGITPYRLEMQAKLKICDKPNLYSFWDKSIYDFLHPQENIIINLASHEYSKCVEKFISPSDRFITIDFGENSGGKLVTRGTFAKMCRGEMVRFMAENNISSPEDIKNFTGLSTHFCPQLSTENKFTFVKE